MRAAPLVAGYPVVDLGNCVRQPAVQLDPLSAALGGHLERRRRRPAAGRAALDVRWVAGRRRALSLRGGRRPGLRPTSRGRSCSCWPTWSSRPPPRSRPRALRRSTTTPGCWSSSVTGGAAWPASVGRRCPAAAGRSAGVPMGADPGGAASGPARAGRAAGPPGRPGPVCRRARRPDDGRADRRGGPALPAVTAVSSPPPMLVNTVRRPSDRGVHEQQRSHRDRPRRPAGHGRQAPGPQRLGDDRPGQDQPLRRRHRRPPVDPRRRRAGQGRARSARPSVTAT